ncbi:MAG: hypothetical protein SAJ12_02310 [Jaaginema sp. PMC 1079.18]|nr:hypothetical protein [Jaaginema sp. PMC 1080.18]MEC4849822.1 hypothetical protein [Jaaginema sp. PMC 1079.18]MEC4865266.1 hypothetical protein [Jaaginema sp. PMC 1078.18]
MGAAQPLQGNALVDCAKASAKQGMTVAAQNCGYGDDIQGFQSSLIEACADMGIKIEGLEDLITDQQIAQESPSIEVAPDSPSSL